MICTQAMAISITAPASAALLAAQYRTKTQAGKGRPGLMSTNLPAVR